MQWSTRDQYWQVGLAIQLRTGSQPLEGQLSDLQHEGSSAAASRNIAAEDDNGLRRLISRWGQRNTLFQCVQHDAAGNRHRECKQSQDSQP